MLFSVKIVKKKKKNLAKMDVNHNIKQIQNKHSFNKRTQVQTPHNISPCVNHGSHKIIPEKNWDWGNNPAQTYKTLWFFFSFWSICRIKRTWQNFLSPLKQRLRLYVCLQIPDWMPWELAAAEKPGQYRRFIPRLDGLWSWLFGRQNKITF